MKLPIEAFRTQIIETVSSSAVTIITADTGAGKSTQVPQYLLEAGFQNIVVTQPRRLAARTVAQRVAEERGEQLGDVIGLRTREERVGNDRSPCMFVTDGLAVNNALNGGFGVNRDSVLVIDETHEWNMNIEVLTALARKHFGTTRTKIVFMSATLDTNRLSSFFDGAPVIDIPGKLYPIENRPATKGDLVADTADLLKSGRNVLVFQPGKAEIERVITALQGMRLNAELLPLHGSMTAVEQRSAFGHYDRPKCVVATNVAQTSITIDDIDAVVDGGLEKTTSFVNGIEGLYIQPISRADARQRRGRAGRTKPGIYIDHCPTENRPDYAIPEVMRGDLSQTILRLAVSGIDMENTPFFHAPDANTIERATHSLKILELIDSNGPTDKGKRVSEFPLSVRSACMLIEAEKRGVVDDVLTAVALLETGDITTRVKNEFGEDTHPWKAFTGNEKECDVLAQMAVLRAALAMAQTKFRLYGIHGKTVSMVRNCRREIAEAVKNKIKNIRTSSRSRPDIIKSIAAGMLDRLFKNHGGNVYQAPGELIGRRINRDSVVVTQDYLPEWVIADPWDLQFTTKLGGKMTHRLLRNVTAIKPEFLSEIAPHLVETRTGIDPMYDATLDSVVSTTEIWFNGQQISSSVVQSPSHEKAPEVFAQYLTNRIFRHHASPGELEVISTCRAIVRQAENLNSRAGKQVFVESDYQWVLGWIIGRPGGACRMADLNPASIQIPELNQQLVDRINHNFPVSIRVGDNREEYTVNYGSGAPYIQIRDVTQLWRIRQSNLFLPGGTLLAVQLTIGWHQIQSIDIDDLRKQVKEWEDRRQWEYWISDAPQIDISTWSIERILTEFDVRVDVAGTSIDHTPIMAYGVVTSDQITHWFRTLEEAIPMLQGMKSTLRKELRKNAAEQLYVTIRDLWYKLGTYNNTYCSDSGLEDRVSRVLQHRGQDLESMEALKVELEAVVSSVEKLRLEAEKAVSQMGDNISASESEMILEFAKTVASLLGTKVAADLLVRQRNAPYGRARIQDAIEGECPQLRNKRSGKRFINFNRASDVYTWLDAAVKWLRVQPDNEPAQTPKSLPSTDNTLVKTDLSQLKAKFNRR